MRIDAHQHFWIHRPDELPWIDASMQRIARDFLPGDLAPELAACGIDGCIAVQARPSAAENAFLLGLAARHPFVRGVVGWTDLCAIDAPEAVARLAREPLLRGLRHLVQDEPDDEFLLRPDFRCGVAALVPHGLVYDLLIKPRHFDAALEFVAGLPDLSIVLDHLGKPDVANGRCEPWARRLRELAAHEHLACKLSGLVTESRWREWRADDLRRYLDIALAAFGPRRVLFGSDWPVCLLAADDYRAVHDLVADWAAALAAHERDALFGGNAVRLYRLQTAGPSA